MEELSIVGGKSPTVAVPLRSKREGDIVQQRLVLIPTSITLHDNVKATLPVESAGGNDHVRVAAQVECLLFFGSGREVQLVVRPRGDQWCHMGTSVGANSHEPEEFGGLQFVLRRRPTDGFRGGGAVAAVDGGRG